MFFKELLVWSYVASFLSVPCRSAPQVVAWRWAQTCLPATRPPAPRVALPLAKQHSPPGSVPRPSERVADHVQSSRCPSWEECETRATKEGRA